MTPYMKVYNRFLSKIRDYPILLELKRDEDFVKAMLYDYMIGAIANFTYESHKVKNRDDNLEQFNSELTDTEIEILAKYMVIEYLNPYLISSDKIENNLSSKDFNSYSPANLMRQISEIQNREKKQATELMVENYYRSNSLWK